MRNSCVIIAWLCVIRATHFKALAIESTGAIHGRWVIGVARRARLPGARQQRLHPIFAGRKLRFGTDREWQRSRTTKKTPDVTIYSDGSFYDSSKAAGWAFIAVSETEPYVLHSGPVLQAVVTKNSSIAAELMAAKQSLSWIAEKDFPQNTWVRINTDYQSVGKLLEGTATPTRNYALVMECRGLIQKISRRLRIDWAHVKAHSSGVRGSRWHHIVDIEAKKAAHNATGLADVPGFRHASSAGFDQGTIFAQMQVASVRPVAALITLVVLGGLAFSVCRFDSGAASVLREEPFLTT